MAWPTKSIENVSRTVLLVGVMGVATSTALSTMSAYAQAAAPAAGRIQGTVKSMNGTTIVVTTPTGDTTVTIATGARVQQSADLKTVSASSLDQVAVGDRVLAMGTAGDGNTFAANRLIVIKSDTLAQRDQKAQQDWNRRGSGGIVTALDPSTNTITISSTARKITVTTTGSTIYRRYAPGSVKFEDAKPGALADVQVGDQLRVRGDKTADGSGITAEEIVSGSFKNLSGTVVSVDASANSLVIKDLTTKKNQTVVISSGSDLRAMPPEVAARFAPKGAGAGAGRGAAAPAEAPAGGDAAAGRSGGVAGAGGRGPGGPGGRGAGDLSAAIARLPKANLADIKPGEALMIVASGAGSGPFTAITLLTGVEPLLTGPAGSELTIPPWSSGGAEGAGAAE
jgi:hypothetical protein